MERRTKWEITLVVISALILAVVTILNYNEPPNKTFSPETFYKGTIGERDDPKKIYDSLYGGRVDPVASCNRTPFKAKAGTMLELKNARYWIAPTEQTEPFEEILDSLYVKGVEGDKKLYIQPFADNDEIICPEKVTFLNANKTSGYSSTYMMEFQGSDGFIIVIEDLKSWWCHIGKEDLRLHTETIGAGGEVGVTLNAGYVIGQASANTKVHTYLLDANKMRIEVDVADYFIKLRGEESSTGSDETSEASSS